MADLEPNNSTINPRSLNDFPEHLLLHILTFLPTLDAVRSSLLSRKWRNLWSTIPSLNFDYSLFPPSLTSPSETRRRFSSFVDQTLILRSPSPLLKLKFQFHYAEYFYWSHIDSWIHYAINHNAVELDIDFYIDREYHTHNIDNDNDNDNDNNNNNNNNECVYDFNFCSLKNSRITDLKICRCDLILPRNMLASKFGSIKSVYLDQIYLADEMVVDLILGCVNMEKMVLDYCYGMKSLRICSSKLKELSLWCFYTQNEEEDSLEICCPNLHSISIIDFQMGKYCIKDSNSLVEAHVDFLQEFRNYSYWSKVVRLFSGVKRLTVQNWWYQLLGQKDSSSDRFALNNLNHLELQTEYAKQDLLGMAALFEISPNITTLTLDDLFKADADNMCQICEEVCHRASRCPWVYSHCSKGNCDGLMMMVTSQQEETFGKKYLKCQYQSCGTWKWLEDAIAAAEVKKQDEQSAGCSNICIYCGQSGHWESLSEELLNEPINFSIPNLKIVKLKNFKGTQNELQQFLTLLKKHGNVMEKIDYHLSRSE